MCFGSWWLDGLEWRECGITVAWLLRNFYFGRRSDETIDENHEKMVETVGYSTIYMSSVFALLILPSERSLATLPVRLMGYSRSVC